MQVRVLSIDWLVFKFKIMNLLKKRTIFSLWLVLYIIALFTFAMIWTYLTEKLQLSGFFGDKPQPFNNNEIDGAWNWGIRHYLYSFMSLALFIVGIARIIMWADWYWEHNKKQY